MNKKYLKMNGKKIYIWLDTYLMHNLNINEEQAFNIGLDYLFKFKAKKSINIKFIQNNTACYKRVDRNHLKTNTVPNKFIFSYVIPDLNSESKENRFFKELEINRNIRNKGLKKRKD